MRPRLIADIGGTNARFALARSGLIADVLVLPVADHDAFGRALDAFLASRRVDAVNSAVIAAAGPRDGNAVKLTNAPWRMEGAEISARLGGVPVRVLNDLEAVALCLPALAAGDVEMLASGAPGPDPLPMLAANVGTGFGAAVAVPVPTGPGLGWTVLGTEAGHMSLAPIGPAETALLEGVRTVEDAFSGPGYARLFGTATEDGGESVHPVAEGAKGGAQGDSRLAYSRLFGRVLGDLALATGAWGGIYLTGGVMSDLHRVVDVETMLGAIRQKGKMADRMERLPVCRITANSPAFRALARIETV